MFVDMARIAHLLIDESLQVGKLVGSIEMFRGFDVADDLALVDTTLPKGNHNFHEEKLGFLEASPV